MPRQSYTAIVARNETWVHEVATEPYEVAWASEAIIFIRALETIGSLEGTVARVQISPDGIHWCDEGTTIPLPTRSGLTFGRVTHFGGWLRLVASLPPFASCKVIVVISLKE